jgi:hypothetical protein
VALRSSDPFTTTVFEFADENQRLKTRATTLNWSSDPQNAGNRLEIRPYKPTSLGRMNSS